MRISLNYAATPLLVLATVTSCATRLADEGLGPARDGVLVLAHGGSAEWNAAVERAVAPLRREVPLAVAFGMVIPDSIERAVRALEARGVSRIAVVRLFVSRESFRHRTEYVLGLRPDPPPSHGEREWAPPRPIASRAAFALSAEGLVEASLAGDVLAARVAALSTAPARESVLIIAHGMGDDGANDRLLGHLERRADAVRQAAPYRDVRVMTLREDWDDPRAVSEERIRAFVDDAVGYGTVIVVPFRLFGFGPYEAVLEGLSYVADGRGLLPHPAVTEWIRAQAGLAFAMARAPVDSSK